MFVSIVESSFSNFPFAWFEYSVLCSSLLIIQNPKKKDNLDYKTPHFQS